MFLPVVSMIAMAAFAIGNLWVNPKRSINRLLAAFGFISIIHFAAIIMARHEAALFWQGDESRSPLPWLRLKWASGAILPLLGWALCFLISGRYRSNREVWLKLSPMLAVCATMMALPFSQAFYPSTSTPAHKQSGPLLTVYYGLLLGSIGALCVYGVFAMRKLSGLRRLEFQLIAIAVGYLMLTSVLLSDYFYYSGYWIFALLAWNISTLRVYHSRQVLLSVAQRVSVIVGVALATGYFLELATQNGGDIWVSGTVIGSAFFVWNVLDVKTRGALRLKTDQQVSRVGSELRKTAALETDPDRLVARFETLLSEFSKSPRTLILRHNGLEYSHPSLTIPIATLASTALISEGLLSAASLSRQQLKANNAVLLALLEREKLPAMVCPRWNQSEPNLVIALGERLNQLTFTFPELRVMRDLAEVVDALYTQARFNLQARQSEQLAAIGRMGVSIAHELRNPMWTLKSFSQLLPEKIDNQEFLREFATIIPQEAERIEALAQQLLDFSKPKKYNLAPIDLHRVIEETTMFSRPQVEGSGITIGTQLSASSSLIVGDKDALRQVLLNLIRNSCEALSRISGPKRITLTTADLPRSIAILVDDNGPGLPTELKGKLFTAFASAGKQGGLGLGLAVCHEIVKVHGGTIEADRSPKKGCLFRIVLPVLTDQQA